MNRPTYLKELDRLLSSLGEDAMRAYIEETARAVSEEEREQFLAHLSSFCGPRREVLSEKEDDDTASEIEEILGKLDEMNAGGMSIESRYNEEWLITQSDRVEPYDFFSFDGVIEDLRKAVSLLHKAVDREVYKKGCLLALKFAELEVEVTGDCEDSPLTLDLLCSYKVLDRDMDTILREALYLIYMGESGIKRRAGAMVRVMDKFKHSSVSLEEILKCGGGESDVQAFLPFWVEALQKKPSHRTGKLLEEAVSMTEDRESLLESASLAARTFPVIYRTILEKGIKGASDRKMLETGLRAVEEVPVEAEDRRDISLLTAEYALKAGDRESAEKCWLEAFRTSSSVTDYLRLRLLSVEWQKFEDEVRRICNAGERNDEQKYAKMFFDGRFEEAFAAMDNEEVDDSFGIAPPFFLNYGASLFLLLLAKDRSGGGISAMTEWAVEKSSFTARDYLMGTGIRDDTPSCEMFLTCFDNWKKNYDIEPVAELWIEKLGALISRRVENEMNSFLRFYYGDCASLIAALGEVIESRGKTDGKNILMEEYRRKYPRRRFFINELIKYGFRR